MNIDTGLAAVIIAVLIFYLRLIVIQRETARRSRLQNSKSVQKSNLTAGSKTKKGASVRQKKKTSQAGKTPVQATPNRSILSNSKLDLSIAGAGLLAIFVGVLANAGVIGLATLQSYWWIPTSLGIIAFIWAFKLPK